MTSYVAAGLMVGIIGLYILLERLRPYDRGFRFLRSSFWTDLLFYGVLQSVVLEWVIRHMLGWVDGETGLSGLRLVTDWPFWAQLTFFIVTHDFYIYWFHRWQHNNKYLWRLHEAHHAPTEVDWLAGVRSHSLEIFINQTVEFAPMVLLGASPEVIVTKAVVDLAWGIWIHSNIDVHSGALQYVVNGPEMHRWHHAADVDPPGFNFATKLAFWDWMFGTGYNPKGKKPARYGLMGGADFPRNYFVQQVFAFRRFPKEAEAAAGAE
jgi:sterol desaturase/sphingolipid hydroxylase (fatty acid hydroxylase superfamily)